MNIFYQMLSRTLGKRQKIPGLKTTDQGSHKGGLEIP